MENSENLIIVTGFGPFFGHESVNASWEAVRLLPNYLEYNNSIYKIKKILVPVEYESVDKIIEDIWSQNPELVIHCGVHGSAKCLHIEKLAYNNKFCRSDYAGKKLKSSKICLKSNADILYTKFNTNEIVKCINTKILESLDNDEKSNHNNDLLSLSCLKTKTEKPLLCSNNVGEYLCGYIYLKSLDNNNERSLFVHVPPLGKPFNAEELSKLIFEVLKECLNQRISITNS